jgi:hypothetical protein
MSGFENLIFCESFSRQEWAENSSGSETSKLTCQTELIQSGWKVKISPNLFIFDLFDNLQPALHSRPAVIKP